MSDPFIAEIVMFGGNFAPRGWALCDGQLMSIAQNSALFSILGTTYGGDGRTTFGLPDLRGRIAMHPGNGAGLPQRRLGEKGGAVSHTLTTPEMPAHSHGMACFDQPGGSDTPVNSYPAGNETTQVYNKTLTSTTTMASGVIKNSGGGQSHNIQNPYQCVNFIIAIFGTFPSRN